MHEHAEADVRERELFAGAIGLAVLELALEDPPGRGGARVRGVERRGVAPLRWRAVVAHQQGPHRRPQHRELPIHPALDMAALHGILRMQPVEAARRREVAQDRVGLPDDRLAVLDGGDQTVGVEAEVLGIPVAAEMQARIDPLEGDVHLRARPQHLLDVRGRGPTPDLEHGVPPYALRFTSGTARC